MRLATIRYHASTRAVRVDGDQATLLDHPDVGALLEHEDWRVRALADGEQIPVDDLDYAQLVLQPSKVICVGLNYSSHILEMGRDLPEYPSLFAKFADSLTGANDDVTIPTAGQEKVDWEAELAVVVGQDLYQANEAEAQAAIAGYTVLNDLSMRDWQRRTVEWLQGKNWYRATPVGPHLVTPDELGSEHDLLLWCEVDGVRMQESRTSDLVFSPSQVLAYASTFTPLRPGDIVATGTPGGVGNARKPPIYLGDGQVVTVGIDGVGQTRNRISFSETPKVLAVSS